MQNTHGHSNAEYGNIQQSDMEASASDQDVWRTVWSGFKQLNDWINTSMKHCAARHMATAKPKTGARCPHCSRLCDLGSLDYAAIFGYMQLADRTILSSATSSSIPTDFSSSSNGECSNTTVYRRNWWSHGNTVGIVMTNTAVMVTKQIANFFQLPNSHFMQY